MPNGGDRCIFKSGNIIYMIHSFKFVGQVKSIPRVTMHKYICKSVGCQIQYSGTPFERPPIWVVTNRYKSKQMYWFLPLMRGHPSCKDTFLAHIVWSHKRGSTLFQIEMASFESFRTVQLRRRPEGVLLRLHWWTLCSTNIPHAKSLTSSSRKLCTMLWHLLRYGSYVSTFSFFSC